MNRFYGVLIFFFLLQKFSFAQKSIIFNNGIDKCSISKFCIVDSNNNYYIISDIIPSINGFFSYPTNTEIIKIDSNLNVLWRKNINTYLLFPSPISPNNLFLHDSFLIFFYTPTNYLFCNTNLNILSYTSLYSTAIVDNFTGAITGTNTDSSICSLQNLFGTQFIKDTLYVFSQNNNGVKIEKRNINNNLISIDTFNNLENSEYKLANNIIFEINSSGIINSLNNKGEIISTFNNELQNSLNKFRLIIDANSNYTIFSYSDEFNKDIYNLYIYENNGRFLKKKLFFTESINDIKINTENEILLLTSKIDTISKINISQSLYKLNKNLEIIQKTIIDNYTIKWNKIILNPISKNRFGILGNIILDDKNNTSSYFYSNYFENITYNSNMSVDDFDIFPNPCRNQFTVNCSKLFYPASLKIENSLGQIVNNYYLDEHNKTFNISSLSNGMYFVSLHQNDKIISHKKLIIEH